MKKKEFAGMNVEHDEDGIFLTHDPAKELDDKLAIAIKKNELSTAEYIAETNAKTLAAREEIRRLGVKIAKLEKEPAGIGGGAATRGDGFLGEPDKPQDREAQKLFDSSQANRNSLDDHAKKWNPKS